MCVVAEQAQAESAGGSSSWTGWAVSSLTSKLYRGGNTPAGATEPGKTTTTGKEKNPGRGVFLFSHYWNFHQFC